MVKGTIKEVDAKAAIVTLAEEVEGVLKASEISRERVEDARSSFNVGDEVQCMVISVDRKNRVIGLSIKARDIAEEKDAIKAHQADAAVPAATLGDLLKAEMDK